MNGKVLTIGGSDPSGGAGIQADIKSITAHGSYAMTALTAVTAQNTIGVFEVELLSPALIQAQIRAVLEDIPPDCIKIGLLYNAEILCAVADILDDIVGKIPVVVDPVIFGKKSNRVLDEEAVRQMKIRLFPTARLITPNIPEAACLAGHDINTPHDQEEVAKLLITTSASNVLVKGGYLQEEEISDILATESGLKHYKKQRIDTPHTHGAGCTLAASIAALLARGKSLTEAVSKAEKYVYKAIQTAPGYGQGCGPLNHVA